MTTITRKQLVDAVEAGIDRAQRDSADFTEDEAVRLRAVAMTTQLVGRGGYHAKTADGSRTVGCPVAQAFPGHWMDLGWDGYFVDAYDRATGALLPPCAPDDVLKITD